MESATRRVGCLLHLSAGGIAAGATVWVVANIWRSCDVGNGSANGAVLLFCFLMTWGVLSSIWGSIFKVLGGKSIAWAYGVAICATVGISWGLIAWIGILDSYPAPVCPGNVPPWWPDFVPV
ncbi:hypothetical protein [Streptomyces sp. NBC_01235]|uniref:hypothetical protein n=1 Tax=Streptomyces sp. NBC_01235 TaxID=2903788 RepID=UPI002E0F9A81|nr:hypothetical protein OG289_19085 [Streptomyces sp. NBC_01235]